MFIFAGLLGLMAAGAVVMVGFEEIAVADDDDLPEDPELPELDPNGLGLVVDEPSPEVTSPQGDQIIVGTEDDESLVGGEGDDQINGYEGNDTVAGGGGADHL